MRLHKFRANLVLKSRTVKAQFSRSPLYLGNYLTIFKNKAIFELFSVTRMSQDIFWIFFFFFSTFNRTNRYFCVNTKCPSLLVLRANKRAQTYFLVALYGVVTFFFSKIFWKCVNEHLSVPSMGSCHGILSIFHQYF